MVLGKSWMDLIHPPKLCAGLMETEKTQPAGPPAADAPRGRKCPDAAQKPVKIMRYHDEKLKSIILIQID